ncbi:AbiH family protein [Acinetobacter shaoyimingii]|uniref:Bacteriophage abortive infection AbiH family protein n=1 Tax=Acinetobacter shaoyimingii TaxID=2715164 RepID=A0A6G8RYS3_9GAMM|nr:AbiH family protein [Acinetobacter shaoyimingii]QIO07000.1 hypothetical protein G8E00_14190 [Acinetobacter shaoyimingii]
MNILIVGNGFDLSHYLPTKYHHFIKVMTVIENWPESSQNMKFDDLFSLLYESESRFFEKTKALYRTDEIEIYFNEIEVLKEKLKGNVWYQFFNHHVNEIDTWIDFEIEFSRALDLVANFIEKAERIYNKHEKLEQSVLCKLDQEDPNYKYLNFKEKTLEKLSLLNILNTLPNTSLINRSQINSKYYRNKDTNLDFDFHSLIKDLEKDLNYFIDLFDWYLIKIIEKLNLKNEIIKDNLNFPMNDLTVLSFNYTNTYKRFYDASAKVEFVHGQVGNELVLGIPDLKNQFLKKFKNYSFTKYHQKLLKNTDYLFLEENQNIKNMLENSNVGRREINIFIWGHSLAESDESYIREIFSLNRKERVLCTVIVYYYENDAPRLLNNLLDILGNEIIEKWMKKGWLKFLPNPKINFGIREISTIQEAS